MESKILATELETPPPNAPSYEEAMNCSAEPPANFHPYPNVMLQQHQLQQHQLQQHQLQQHQPQQMQPIVMMQAPQPTVQVQPMVQSKDTISIFWTLITTDSNRCLY